MMTAGSAIQPPIEQGIAVGRGPRRVFDGEAAAVFDDDLLAECAGEIRGDEARGEIIGAAWFRGDDTDEFA